MGHYLSEMETPEEHEARMKRQEKLVRQKAAERGWAYCPCCGAAINPGIQHGSACRDR